MKIRLRFNEPLFYREERGEREEKTGEKIAGYLSARARNHDTMDERGRGGENFLASRVTRDNVAGSAHPEHFLIRCAHAVEDVRHTL